MSARRDMISLLLGVEKTAPKIKILAMAEASPWAKGHLTLSAPLPTKEPTNLARAIPIQRQLHPYNGSTSQDAGFSFVS